MTMAVENLPRYERYKDSGIDWLGKIPEHWNVAKLNHHLEYSVGFTPESGNDEYYGEGYDWANISDLGDKYLTKTNKQVTLLAIKRFKPKLAPKDCLLYSFKLSVGTVSITTKDIYTNEAIAAFYPSSSVKTAYLFYMAPVSIIHNAGENIYGAKILNQERIDAARIIVPSIEEQSSIANFLDKKTTQIDQAINIKEQQIALLKERKQIIIQNAVTKGLDSNVPMKDSGVDWIGEIPAHWEVDPGMNVLREKKDSNKGMKESRVLSLSYGEIIIKPEEKLVGLVPESFETYQIAVPGDIIIRCTDLQNDQTSLRTGLVKDKGIITSAYLNLNVKEPHFPEFVHYFLHFLDITKVLYKFGSGLRQNLSWGDFKRMPMVIVPYYEQKEIVKYIEDKSAEIKSATDLLIQQINNLKEYKATLINSTVTGKIKVI